MNRDRFCRASHVNYLILALIFLSIAVANAAFFTPGDVPGPPEKVLVSPASDTSMRVQFYPPLNVKPEGVNGAPVLGYKVEVARRVDEVQTFSVAATGPILSGGYKVTFKNSRGTETTSCIPWNASEVALEMALEELPNVDSVGVSRSVFGAAKNGFVYRVTFDGAYLVSGRQSDLLVGDTTGCQAVQPPNRVLSFEGAHVTSGAPGFYPEVWEIASTESSGAKVLGGTFDLSIGFEGQWINTNPVVTATVAAGSRTAKTVGSMLGVVNRGDRVRIGGEEFTVHATAPFTDSELPLDSYHVRGVTVAAAIQVMDTALGNVQVSKTSNLVPTSVSFSSRIADGEQVQIGSKVFKVANVGSTSFTLDSLWTDDTTLHVTAFARKKATLSVNAEAAEMKRALSVLPGVGAIDVSRIGPTKANGYHWYVTFQSLDSVRLRVDKKTGTTDFVDVYGVACVTCTVTASVVQDDTQTTTLAEIKGDYSANAVVASTEVGGVVQEVQTISTKASADDISGYFTVSFQSVGGAVINFDDTAADVRTKLQSLATIGRLNVTRSENSDFGATWTVTFLSNMGDLPPLVATAKTLLKGTGVNVVVQEIVKGVDVALETIIEGLDPGQNYYVRAFARNENGYGASTTDLQQRGRGALPLLTAVSTSPDPPGINGMWPLSGSQLELRLSNPVDHGDSVSKYLFEYAVGDSFGKVATKKVFVFNSIENDITGTFRLQYGDDVTSLLSVHTTASSLQSALNSLSSVRPVSVSRALYVLTGSPSVTFTSANNRLTTPTLNAFQCAMLAKGAGIDVGGKRFIVRVQPVEGSSSIDVELGHGAPDFTANKDLLKLDSSGSERGPYGYIWTISFDNDAGDVVHGKYPGLQFISQLTSIDTSLAIPVSSYGVELGKTGIPADHYGFFEINNDDKVCDTYVVGAPSSVQVVRLFAPTTATDGSFKLKLGSETTADCITLGKSGTLSSLKANLEALDLVSKVTVDEVRAFKVTTTATVTDYDNTGKLTVASAFTSAQVDVLLQDSIIQVSRNPNDFSRHSCEFVVDAPPTAGLTKISVTPRGSCDYFTDEARVLKILDFHDYHVRFWGYYPTGEWPTLQFDYSEFGKGTCTLWAPPNLQVYGQIHTVKYEGVCSKGQAGVQTILADASSTIGGTFTLSYMGEVTSPLSFKDTGAGEMRDAIDSITAPGTVNVSVSQYGAYGKAWHVTFLKHQDDEDDAIFIQHSRLTGQNALISVYPTVTVFTDAKRDDISGSFRIAISGETTEPIGFSATHMKVTQELQKLSVVDSVVALGDKSTGDVGVYALELTADATAGSSLLTNIKLGGAMIDPTRFLAIGETLVLGSPSASYTVKAMTLSDITLFTVFPVSATSANFDVLAGLITKQTKPLPGYVGISALMQVVAVTKGSNEFQMPADHEFSSTTNNVFFVGNTKFTVTGVTGAKVTTNVPYPGDTIAAASPKVYVFDNRLQTTEDLRKLVKVGDDLWLPSVSADMNKYTVTAVNKRYLEVSGGFTETITRTLAYHVSNGRKWNLVFRSYDGSLDTIDAIPEHDWRGTNARIGTRSPKAVSPNVISVGNPASTQTIHLEVRDVAIATPYTLSFGGETVLVTGTTNAKNIPWATINDDLKNALETLDSVDGVSVVSTVNGGTVIHTVSFWGTYPMKKLPLLVVTPATANLNAYVQGNNAVAVTKQDNLILESSRAYAFRIFVLNSRGISDSVSVFEAQTSASSVVPTPPTGVALGEFHGSTWLSLNYWAPFYSGGAQVSMFRIEWDSSPNFDSSSNDYGVTSIQETYEVQQVTTSYRTAGAGGTFALSWGGRKTSALPFDCSESEMTDALAIITGTVNVAVDPLLVKRDKVAFGFTWKITFLHNKGDLAPLAADGRQLTGDSPRISVMELVQGFSDLATGDFTHEVQDVVTDGVSPITGSFTLTFNGKNTGTILVSASAFEMQAVLQATTASYSIKVTKTAQTAALNTAIWSVTFAYLRGEEMVGAGNIFTMTVASSQLMGTDAVVRVANKVTGSDPFRFTVTDLRPGVKYYAHVMAYNADGFGSANSPLASAVTCSQPPAPKTVTASVVDGTTLQVDWSASTVGELCSVDKYKVDWYRSEGTQEQQTITTSAGKGIPEIQSLVNFADSQTLGGYFKLSFGGEVTENIRWDAPATGLNSVKERLERLSTVGTVGVSKAESMRVIGGLLVTATSTTVAVHGTATTTIGGSKLAQGDVIWINGNKRTINAAVGVTDTTFTIDTALDITVPVPVYKSAYGYEWTITFLGGHVGPQELIQVSPSDRWTGDKAGIAVDSVQKGLQPISGTFRVAFSSGGLSDSTPPLPHNISALDMKTALENLVTIGAVNVARSTNGYGFNWVITFVSEFKNDISLLSVDGTELQGPGAKILAARTLNGVQPSWYCERNGATDVPVEIGVPGQLRYVIPGLKTGEKYTIRVRAHNSEGYGYAGSIRPTFQIPRTIPSAPQAVELLALSSRLVKLRWDVPISNGGAPISSYQIQWATSADFTNPMRTDYLVSSTDTAPFYYNIPVASAGKYYVRVFAVNSQGDGAFAVPSPSSITPVDRTPGRPEDPTAKVLSSYAILVEWKPSSTEKTYYGGDGGLPITQYMVEWDASAGFDSPPAFGLVDGTKRSFIIGGDDAVTGVRSEKLTAGSTYSIRVTAFNAKGAGAPRVTTPAFVTVTDQPPSSPQNLKLSVVTSKSVKAEWMNPLYDGGASLKSYLVEWDEQDDFSSGQSSSATIPIIREMQSVTLQNDVVNEEQFVDATVKVTNEEQVVRTTFTGVDEVQVITTTNSVVVDEVQTVVTTATDRNEVQELRLDGDDVDEVQAIRTSVPEVLQIQTIKVVVPRTSEVQTLTLTLPGAFATPATSIGGTIFLSFDSSICTHCVKKMYQRTINLVSSLQDTTASSAALTVKNALIDLANVDKVDVTRTQNPTGPDLTYVYTIVFSGLEVGGNVPTLGIDAAVTVGGNAVSGIPTQAVQTTAGSELDYASSAVFTVKYTCESYSDPNAITTFSTACTPGASARICAGCVTSFLGGIFTVAGDLTADTYVVSGAKLIAGVCSFEAGTVTKTPTSTTIVVAANDVGLYCSEFSGKTLNLYKTPQMSRDIPLKTAATTISSASVVEGLLTGAIDSATVARSEFVDDYFVGSVYTLTIRRRSGTIPTLLCSAAGSATCTVTPTVTGSMIIGTFQIGLVSEADAMQTLVVPTPVYTGDIPWDVSETDLKSNLESITQGTKKVFGTVTVKRSVYSPTGNKWSGGFTWQITFSSRGGNIPKMVTRTVVGATKTLTTPTNGAPTASVEDATHPLDPFANSRDGNQVLGALMLKFRDVTSTLPCRIGVDTSLASLDVSVRDTVLESFIITNLKIPTIEIMRSAATQAIGFTWTISFSDASTGGVYETVKGNQLGGDFQLSFNGETTAPIAFNAEASEVQTELNKLGTIKPSSVVVSRGGPTSTQVLGYTWYVTFRSSKWVDPTSDHSGGIDGNWKSSSPASWDDVWESGYSKAWGRHVGHTFLVKCITDGLTTTASDGSQNCVPSVSTTGVGPIKGSFTVSIDSRPATYSHMAVNSLVTSVSIAHNAWATKEQSGYTETSVEEILEKMGNVGDVAVTRGDVVTNTGGYSWTVTFLRDASDASHACEQLEEAAGSLLCNAPGNVPEMVPISTSLTGASSVASVVTIKDGTILRGDFTDFRVQGDAGVAARYFVSLVCTNAPGAVAPAATSCSVSSLTIKADGELLQKQLLPQDRITVGTFKNCIFTVTGVSTVSVTVTATTCSDMDTSNTGATTWLGLSILLPWNADENLVERQLEAAATNTGRQVSVKRTEHGKYGEMSWLVRFISNPTFTPPGAGDLPDITTTFAAEAGSSKYDMTVTQVTPGSKGLSGSFLLDFHSSSFGPREIFFDEDPDRLQRKLNEMDTVGRVTVKRYKYPSSATGCTDPSCSGGWDDVRVKNRGTRGGYRWRIRFMQATGDYKGFTFPPGSGDVASLSVSRSALQGTGVSVDVYTNVPGSSPSVGAFALNTSESQTPALPYSSSAEEMKLGIEAMDLFGEVDVTQGYLLTQKIPGATATLTQDGVTATITGVDDIRQYIARTDIIRFGSTSVNNLVGTNGDAPFTGLIDTSRVKVTARSPVVVANAETTRLLYPGMQLRIDGLVYNVQRTGHEVQTLTATRPSTTWSTAYVTNAFQLTMTRNGVTKPPTNCLRFNEDAATVQAAIFGLLFAFDTSATSGDVLVSRVGPSTFGSRIGYVYSVYFTGESVAGDVAPLKVDYCAGIGDATVTAGVITHGGKIPQQRLMFATDYGQVEDTKGFFQLVLNSQSSACIKWGAPASDVKLALEKTPLSSGNVVVTRSGNGTSQTEIQRIRMTANTAVTAVNGLFRVQFTLNGQTSATSCLKYGVSAEGLEVALNGLSNLGTLNNIDHINVTRTGDGGADWGYGYEYLIHFQGPISGGTSRVLGDVPQLVIGNVGTGACSSGAQDGMYPALMIETVRQGAPGFTYDIFFMDYKAAPTVNLMSLKSKDNGDNVCLDGWAQKGGSVRKAYVEMVELGGSSEVQVVTVKDTGTGSYAITFGGQTSPCLLFTASANDVATAIQTLTGSGVGDILVSLDKDLLVSPDRAIYRITFVGDAVTGNLPLLGAVQNSDTACANTVATTNIVVEGAVEGGGPSGEFALTTAYDGENPNSPHTAYSVSQQFRVMDEQFEIQQLVVSNPSNNFVSGETYTLKVLGTNTNPIPWDVSETALQLELTSTARIALTPTVVGANDLIVTRRTNADVAPHGFIYMIYFSGSSVTGNVAATTVVAATGAHIAPSNIVASTIRQGVAGISTLTANSIPLALPEASSTAARYLSSAVEQKLEVYKVNGFLWMIKFKSSLGNIPKLGKQTSGLLGGSMTIQDDFVSGSASNTYAISNLLPGITYYAHVAAWTDVGIGSFSPSASVIPSSKASGVQNLAAGYALYEREVQEIRLAASHVMEIQEISTTAARVAEVQTLRTFAPPSSCPGGNCIRGRIAFRVPTVQTVRIWASAAILSGTFTLLFEREVQNGNTGTFSTIGAKTGAISWNAPAFTVKTSLATVVNGALGTNDVVVTRDGDASVDFQYGYVFQITFIGNNVAGETKKIVCDDKTFIATGGATVHCDVAMNTDVAMGTDTAVQQIVVSAKKPLAVGSYKVHFNYLGLDQVSGCIPFDASAKTMETSLEAMPNIDNVYVTRETDVDGFVYTVFFHGNGVYGNTPLMIWLSSDTGCTAFQTMTNNALTSVGVDGKVEIKMLDWGGFNTANTFVYAANNPITGDADTAAQLTTDLNRLPVFGDVLVSQSIADEQGGYIWTIVFEDSQGNLPQFICAVDPSTFTATGSGCETDTRTDGNVLSGSFLIEPSSPIPFNADADIIKTALEAMPRMGTVQVKRSEPSPQFGYTWTITFLDYKGDVPMLRVTSLLVGTSSQILVREVRKGNALGGMFTLTYANAVTTPIGWNAAAMAAFIPDGSSMQEKLEALDVVGKVNVVRTGPDEEGGYTWVVTFLDNFLNSGDVPLLRGNASALTGEGAVVFTKEVTKGSNAVGDQLWLSFDPPATDNGSPITKYQVRWDTSDKFTANPADVFISDAEILYRTLRITTSAASLAWSNHMIRPVDEVQKLKILTVGTFELSFRGETTATLTAVAAGTTAGATTVAGLETALETLSSVGSVDVTSAKTVLEVGAEVLITFTAQPGDLPLLKPSSSKASVDEIQTGKTNFRKEVVVFSCTATAGTVRFSYNGEHADVGYNAALTAVETSLLNLFGVEAESISVSSATQLVLCKSPTPDDVKIVFDRVYGDITLSIDKGVDAGANAQIVFNTEASIDGVYNDDPALTMSGTFQVGYQGLYTRPLNAESSADQLRYALEDLDSIRTASVNRELSYRPVPGKVDVTEGEIFVTCSAGETCSFYSAAYGLPGYKIRIGGDWYTVRADLSSPGLHKTRLYLGDLNGREIGYLGSTDTTVSVYEWTKGYVWTVDMLSVASLSYIRAKVPRLYPTDSTVRISGSGCDKCYYLPTQTSKKLTMGQLYFVEVTGYNDNGKGAAPVKGLISATPSQVPSSPSNVNVAVISGKEIEVFFSPPPLATTNVSPNFNNDISSYIVQWDVNTAFKHGRQICANCASQLNGITLTVSVSLSNFLVQYSKFTFADDSCVLTVDTVGPTSIQVQPGHSCANFNGQAYPLYYYTYPPQVLSGSAIQGTPPFRYVISNLVSSKTYYVRVAAVNSVPVQQIALSGEPPNNRQWSYHLTAITADKAPDPPLSVYLNPFSSTMLELQIQPSTRDGKGTGGTAITAFWIDVDTVSTFDSVGKRVPVEVLENSGNIPELYSGGPRLYLVTGLVTGTRYFAQVKSVNSIGYSRASIAPNPQTPTRHPNVPVNVRASTLTVSSSPITAATVTWQKPADAGGLPLTGYKVEWWRPVSRPEIQTIELKWTTQPSAAPFTLSFGGLSTAPLPMDVSAANLRFALMGLASLTNVPIGHIEVSRVAVNIVQGFQWIVTFSNTNQNAGNQPLIQYLQGTITAGSGVSGRVFEVQPGVAVPATNSFPGTTEAQVLVTYHTTPVGGYFRLSYKGSAWTNYLSATVSAADLKLALEALPTIGVVTVNLETMLLSGAAWSNGRVWTITFDSNVGNLAPLVVDSSRITPAAAFVGVKDGDNAVDTTGVLCLPDGTTGCPGLWPAAVKSLKQQAAPLKSIAQLSTPGEVAVDYGYYETLDASMTTYTVPGLTPGNAYSVAVSARNAQGFGARTLSSPNAVTPPVQVPGPPVNVSVDVNPGYSTQLVASWDAPVSDGGSPVWMYRVEYDVSSQFTARGHQDQWCPVAPTPAIWVVQTVRTSAPTTDPISSGYFRLELTRRNIVEVSDPIPWNAVAGASDEASSVSSSSSGVFCTTGVAVCTTAQIQTSGSMQSKLGQFSQLESGVEVTRSAGDGGGYMWTITFLDGGDDFSLMPRDVNLACTGAGCTGTYDVLPPSKSRAGVKPSSCTGSHVIPTSGALNKGQLYYVRVFAYNQIGFGDPQLAVSPQKPMVVPGAPTGVTLAVLTVSELVVLFNPPDDNGGDTVAGYEVQWATDTAFTSPSSALVQLTTGMSSPYKRIITSLTKGTRYYVRVRARNSQGLGQFQVSSPASQRPYTTPSSPTQVVLGITCSTMLTVGWAPPIDDGGDAVSGYIVQWDVVPTFDSLATGSTTAVINDATQRAYTITLLTPGTRYYVRVFAKNLGGKGTPQTSTPASIIPATTRPGKPNSLAAAPTATVGQLQVVWQPPRMPAHGIPCAGTLPAPQSCPVLGGLDMVFGGVSLESYLVQYADSSDFSLAKEVSVTTTSAIVSGLESGKTYYVRVLTVNSQGLNSDFCMRANAQGLLCPGHLVLEDGSVVTGDFVFAAPK
ncbi:Fibronectin type III domain [Phytophthora infestans]|uniref:Fibronectin type III domain n=1 Tax=Phytophthora infestans TaxID=4787 RepID=A0A8S9VAR4_PHYIN|nr:Fibronectin type III domain [Phytophthora infestans]